MGILELIGELISPGPAGSVRVGRPVTRSYSVKRAVLRGVFSAVGLGLLLAFAASHAGFWGIVASLVYTVAGTVLRPEPDFSNVGWLGGLINDPLRVSDDVNRFLVFVLLFLLPGRFIGTGLLALAYVLWMARRDANMDRRA